MPSEQLKALIALRWATKPTSKKSIEALRGKRSDGGFEPRDGTKVKSADADGVYGEWVVYGTPRSESIFLFLHGGGFCRSSGPASRRIASNLSAACGCRCFTVDYRLAPEHTFPAAIDDTFTAYQWLLKQGIPPKRIVVGGSSAGGGLTASLLAKLKQTGLSQPAAAVFISPWTDLTQSASTYRTNADADCSISKDHLDRMAEQYLDGADPKHPLASPVFTDLSGLPPLLVQVGKLETMYGDAEAYAAKARRAGAPVEFEAYDHVPHAWHNSDHLVPDIPEVHAAINRIGEFFKAHSGGEARWGAPIRN